MLRHLPRPRSTSPVVAISLLALSRAAFAADTAPADAPAADPAATETVTVTALRHYVATDNKTATKTDTPILETPQSISVVTQDELQLLHVQNLEQATRYTAGIVSGSYGADDRFDWLTLRGFVPTKYLDGLQLPTAVFAQSRLDLYGMEQLDILKGPSSVLYGQVPPGGLVNMESKMPTDQAFGEVQGQFGSFASAAGAFDVGGPIDDQGQFLYRLTGLDRENDTQTDHVHDKRIFIAPAATWNIMPGMSFTFLSHYQYDRTGTTVQFLPSQGTLLANPFGPIPEDTYVSEPNHDHFERREYDVGYKFDYRLNDTWSFHQGFRFGDVKATYDTIYGAGLQADLRTLNRYAYLIEEDARDVSLDSNATARFQTGPLSHELLFGVDYRHGEDEDGTGFATGPSIDVYNPVYGAVFPRPAYYTWTDQNQDQVGLYAQDQIKWNRVVVTLSGRNDWVDTSTRNLLAGGTTDQDDSAFSYRGGINYLFDNGISPYVSYSHSFVPTLGTDFDGTAFKPTTAKQVEVGVKYQPPGYRSLLTVAGYDLTETNATTTDPAHEFYSVQTGEAEVKGIEVEGVARLSDSLSLNLSYAYTHSEVTKSNGDDLGEQLILVPKHQASALADYTLKDGPAAGLGFGGGVRYIGASFGDAENQWRAPSYTLLDAIVHYDLAHWRFSINANNLLDRRYVATCNGANYCYYGSSRTVLGTIAYHW
jgi:iron complex outermembrane recepter protein